MRCGLRSRASIVVESGEARETHHFAVLLGYGASAINPYLALDTAREAVQRGQVRKKSLTEVDVVKNYIKAAEKGILKIMSKMGIASVDAYTGAQIFEAIGLSQAVIDQCFTGTPSRIGGVGFAEIEQVVLQWHAQAYADVPVLHPAEGGAVTRAPLPQIKLDHPGFYKERAGGEAHGYSQRAVHALQKATRRRLGRSLAIREVDAGSCNGCELEIHALNNPYYNMHRLGFFVTPTPRHADVLLVVGPGTDHMRVALKKIHDAMRTPRTRIGIHDNTTTPTAVRTRAGTPYSTRTNARR